MSDIKPNIILEVANADHVQSMRNDWIEDRWSEHAKATDEADLHKLLVKVRKAGHYGLANEMRMQWNKEHNLHWLEAKEIEQDYRAANGWPHELISQTIL